MEQIKLKKLGLTALNAVFTDTDEGVTIVYNERGFQIGVVLWVIDDNYGSVTLRYLPYLGCGDEELTVIRVKALSWEGINDVYLDGKKYMSFSTLDEAEDMITGYLRKYANEDMFIKG